MNPKIKTHESKNQVFSKVKIQKKEVSHFLLFYSFIMQANLQR